MKNIRFVALFALLAVTGAKADPRDDALSAMLRCSGIADRAQRLACYDSASARAPGALNDAAPSPAPVMASAVPPPKHCRFFNPKEYPWFCWTSIWGRSGRSTS